MSGPEVEEERAQCHCTQTSGTGLCARWFCREWDDGGRHEEESEYYVATLPVDNATAGVVLSWTGDINSKSEFELTQCQWEAWRRPGASRLWPGSWVAVPSCEVPCR